MHLHNRFATWERMCYTESVKEGGMSERDTHFRGFAELLLAELYDNNFIEFAGDSEKLQLLYKTTTQRLTVAMAGKQ